MTAKTEMPEKSSNSRILQDRDNYYVYLCVLQMPIHSHKATPHSGNHRGKIRKANPKLLVGES